MTAQPTPPPNEDGGASDPSDELSQVRALFLAPDRRRVADLEAQVDAQRLTPTQLAEQLPEAIALRSRHDSQLASALAPTVQSAIRESVRRRPADFADAIFPILGPAIRKAIAESLAELVRSINRAMEHSFSPRRIRWRIEAARSGVPFAQIVLRRSLVYRVEQVFLIHGETGLLLAHASAPDIASPNPDLVSSMLSAIRDFVADSFRAEPASGGLRRFSVGELTVLVEAGPHAALAVVVKGEADERVLRTLQRTIEDIHALFGAALAEFDGDDTPFSHAVPLLHDCLMTALDGDAKANAPVHWKAAIVVATVVALALAVLYSRSVMQWRRALTVLEATPGIAVTAADRSLWSGSIRGLRDPDAASPNAVLAAAGSDTTRIRGVWAPYLALDSMTTISRARRVLAAPSEVHLSLRGDTLIAAGTAPFAWIARVQSARAFPAGASAMDFGGVSVAIPAELQPMADTIAGLHVLFDVGRAALDADGLEALGRLAGIVERFQTAVRAGGGAVEVQLVGRSDPTGNDSANQELSRLRAETCAAALRRHGTLRDISFVPKWLGTSQPIDAPTDAARARLNRSVSFAVRLLPHADRAP